MSKYIKIISFLIFAIKAKSQINTTIENEIKNLKTTQEINQYWQDLKNLDQSKRGLNSNDSIDNINYKKVILLIKHHGYPKFSNIPNLIATHQRSQYVNEYYFPIFYEAYKNDEADGFWFWHILRGIHRGRFGRDFIRGRQIEDKDVDTIVKRLSPYINKKKDLDITKFDSLFSKYVSDVKKITSSELVYHWKTHENDQLFFYRYQDKLFYHKIWNDNSYGLPQEIKFNKDKSQYEYALIMYNDFFKIDDAKNLTIYYNGLPIEVIKIHP